MVCPLNRHRFMTRMRGTLVVAEKIDSPLRLISTVYAEAFATGAQASHRLDGAGGTAGCAVVGATVAAPFGGTLEVTETAGLAVLGATEVVALGGMGGGEVAAASLSVTSW